MAVGSSHGRGMFIRRALHAPGLRVLAAPPEDFGRLIRELRPQQALRDRRLRGGEVMLETCEERLRLSRQEVGGL